MRHSVEISYAIVQNLLEHAQKTPEIEVCGMLGGITPSSVVSITAWQALPNIAQQPGHAYQFDPEPFIQTYYAWQRREIDWLGVYHSHPTGPLMPSQTDIAQAHYADKIHLIMGEIMGEWQITVWSLIADKSYQLSVQITD